MSFINIRVNKNDKRSLESYANSKNKITSDVIRESIDNIIENETHLQLY